MTHHEITEQVDLLNTAPDFKKTVTQSNLLIDASYDLSLLEKRLFVLTASKVNPLKWKQEWKFTISAYEWKKAFGSSNKNNVYRDMEIAANSLMEQKPVDLQDIDGNLTRVHWVSEATYKPKMGEIDIELSSSMRFYLALNILNDFGFTSVALENIGKLNSVYAMRIYEMLIKFLNRKTNRGWLKISPDDLIFIFQLPDSYKKNKGSIKQKILEPSLKKINKSSNLNCTLSTAKKTGRTISLYLIEFNVKESNGYS